MNEATIWIEEDGYCGGSVASSRGAPPLVTKRVSPRYPNRALRNEQDGYASVRLFVDPSGSIKLNEVVEETPGYAFGDAAKRGFAKWDFAPGRPGMYCLRATFKIGPSQAPWVDFTLPRAPNPIDIEPAPEISEAAVAAKVECRVELNLRIDEDGAVANAAVMEQSPDGWNCGRSAIDAVEQWHFPPDTPPGRYRMTLRIK